MGKLAQLGCWLIAMAAAGLSGALASPAAPVITVDRTFARVAGWSVGFSQSLGGCLAAAAYRDGTTIWFGFGGASDKAFLAFTNAHWRSIEVGQSYEIGIRARGERDWHGAFAGFERNDVKGIFTAGLKDQFVSDLASAGQLDLSLEGKRIASLSLVGSMDALASVSQCQEAVPTFQADATGNTSSTQTGAQQDAVPPHLAAADEAATRLKTERLQRAVKDANEAVADASDFVRANGDDAQVLGHIQHIADLRKVSSGTDPAGVERKTAELRADLDADPVFLAFEAHRIVERKQEDARYLADAMATLKVQKAFLIQSLVQDPTSPEAPDLLSLEKQAEAVIAAPDLDHAKIVMGLIDAAIEKGGLQASYALARSVAAVPSGVTSQTISGSSTNRAADVAGPVKDAPNP